MDLATSLLDAHVAYQIRQLRGARFTDLVEREVRWALARAGNLTLDQVVARDSVKGVARKYVAAFALPGAIPEMVGDVALRLRTHPANVARVDDVVPRSHVVAIAEKIAGQPQLREWIAVQIANSPTVQAWLAQYLYSLTTGAVDANVRLAKKVPGVSLGMSLGNRLAGGAVSAADQRAQEGAERAAAALLRKSQANLLASLSDEAVALTLLGVWDRVSDKQVGELIAAVPDDDLVDAMSILYDLWLDLRTNEYLLSLIYTGVDYFFDTYGAFGLDELLAEFGLSAADLVEEALRFAPLAIEALDTSGLLAELVRRQLAGFYDSPEARDLLA